MAKATKKPTVKKTRKPVDTQKIAVSACKNCGSIKRTKYYWTKKQPHHTTDPTTGRSTTHRKWRKCTCQDCGQVRVDITDVCE